MEPTQTALIAAVPEAEEAVGLFREALDTAASWGVPAHVTVLYPFMPPERIDDQVLAAVGDTVAAVPRFDMAFTRVGWFGDAVVWLAPEPADPLRRLTAAVWERFPETPPYAGEHTDPVPHLTIGDGAATHLLTRAAEAVSAYLPIRATVEVVRLISGSPEPDSWHTVTEFPLGGQPRDR